MKSFLPKMVIAFCLLFQYHIQATAQAESSPILFIYDASGSMWGQLEGKTKMEIAADVLSTAVTGLPDDQQVGLMAYGHRKKGDCDDVELLVDLNNSSKEKVISSVKGIKPLGKTPLARSATMAINSLRESGTKATVILVTDGIESCDGDLCKVISEAKAEGIAFKLHIVGFGLKEGETEQLKCAAAAGEGQYYDAADAEGLSEVLNEAMDQTVDDPDNNYSIYATKNGEAVDAWVRAYKPGTKEEVDHGRTYQDTAFISLPPGKYDIFVQPLEGTDISGITINVVVEEEESGHQTVSFDGATLTVFTSNNEEGWDAMVKIHDKASGKVAAQTRTYGRERSMEVNPGIYDISFQALKMSGMETKITIEDVELKGGETQSLSQNFETGIARIGVTTGGELVDATVNVSEVKSGTRVAGGRTYTRESSNPKEFILNPGNYTVKIVTLGKHKGHSETLEITVKTGETVEKIISY